MQPATFYTFFAKTEQLFFFGCSPSHDFIEEYASILIHLYELPQEEFNQACFCIAFEGNPEDIIQAFNKNNGIGIKERKLEKVSSVLYELDRIFRGQTDVPFMYIDGEEEHIEQHYVQVKSLFPHFQVNLNKV